MRKGNQYKIEFTVVYKMADGCTTFDFLLCRIEAFR